MGFFLLVSLTQPNLQIPPTVQTSTFCLNIFSAKSTTANLNNVSLNVGKFSYILNGRSTAIFLHFMMTNRYTHMKLCLACAFGSKKLLMILWNQSYFCFCFRASSIFRCMVFEIGSTGYGWLRKEN